MDIPLTAHFQTPNRFASLGVIHIQSFGFGLQLLGGIFADKH